MNDFDVTICVAWTGVDEGNQLWVAINTFDDFYDRDLLRGSRTVGDDGWTFALDPDHSGGGIDPDGVYSNGQEWTFQAAGDADVFALQGFSDSYSLFWANQPPHLVFATGPASGKPWSHGDENVTINYEWRMTLFSFFDAAVSTGEGGAETSTVMDLTENTKTHLMFQGDDWDGGDSWDGAWATSNESGATGNGDSMNSFTLIVDPDVEAAAPHRGRVDFLGPHKVQFRRLTDSSVSIPGFHPARGECLGALVPAVRPEYRLNRCAILYERVIYAEMRAFAPARHGHLSVERLRKRD